MCQRRGITNPDSLCRRQKPVSTQHIYCRHSCLGDSSHPACDRPIYFPFLSATVSLSASQRTHWNCHRVTAVLSIPPPPAPPSFPTAHHKHIHASTPPFPEACVSRHLPALITPLLPASGALGESMAAFYFCRSCALRCWAVTDAPPSQGRRLLRGSGTAETPLIKTCLTIS